MVIAVIRPMVTEGMVRRLLVKESKLRKQFRQSFSYLWNEGRGLREGLPEVAE